MKKRFLETLSALLAEQGFDTEQVMVILQDLPWENWSAAGGRLLHA